MTRTAQAAVALSIFLLSSSTFAQQPGRGPGAAPPEAGRGARMAGRGPAVNSPEVHPDRRVTLRIAAPKASSVTVSGEIMGLNPPAALAKGDDGVWSVTLGPLEPEIYSYGFSVDGVTVNDQRTSYVKPSSSYTSQVVVPGNGPRFYDARPVPHGDVRMVVYEAKTLGGMTRRMRVYTPPDYGSGNKKYPVLYLFHGAGDWDVAWTDVGRANLIMDNLIADGKAKPMLVVMPSIFQREALGTGALASATGPGGAGRGAAAGAAPPDPTAAYPALMADIPGANRKLKVFNMYCGKDDSLVVGGNRALSQALLAKGVNLKYIEGEGGHWFIVWRQNLRDFAPLLFR